jgi:hypothetical protein
MSTRFISLAVLCLVLSTPAIVGAQAQERTERPVADFARTARPIGLGEAFHSVSTGTSGLYYNPAGIATARMYSVGGTYEFTPQGNVLNASIVDSKTNRNLAAGVGYSYMLGRDQSGLGSGHDIRLALAVPALKDRVSIGIEGRYVIFKGERTEIARGFTMKAGFLFQLIERLHLGVSGSNLIDICNQPRRCQGVTPLTINGGISYGESTSFLVTADVGVDLNSQPGEPNLEYKAGAEYLIGGSVPVRLGYQHRTLTGQHLLGGGLGWRTSRFGIDVGGRLDVRDATDVYVSSSFSVYFN